MRHSCSIVVSGRKPATHIAAYPRNQVGADHVSEQAKSWLFAAEANQNISWSTRKSEMSFSNGVMIYGRAIARSRKRHVFQSSTFIC